MMFFITHDGKEISDKRTLKSIYKFLYENNLYGMFNVTDKFSSVMSDSDIKVSFIECCIILLNDKSKYSKTISKVILYTICEMKNTIDLYVFDVNGVRTFKSLLNSYDLYKNGSIIFDNYIYYRIVYDRQRKVFKYIIDDTNKHNGHYLNFTIVNDKIVPELEEYGFIGDL